MKKTIIILLAIIGALSMSACNLTVGSIQLGPAEIVRGSGDVIVESREIEADFDKIDLSGIGNLDITQGDDFSLEVKGEDNIVELIETEVRGSTLYIGVKDRKPGSYNIIPTEKLYYTVVMPDLARVTLSGAGNIEIPSLETEELRVTLSGAGALEIEDLNADLLVIEISGAGSVDISGAVVEQRLHLSGMGNYDARDLESQIAEIDLSGVGSGTVWVTESLDVTISGVGSLNYYGDPRITENVSGLGDLNHKVDR